MDGCSLRLLKSSRNTLCEMLIDRGYSFTKDIDLIVNDVHTTIEGHKGDNCLCVHFLLKKRQVPSLKECIAENQISQNDPTKSYCVVTSNSVNKTFKALCSQFNIEHFVIHTLGVNITRHTLVPKHTLFQKASNEEYFKTIKSSLSLHSLEQLPIMKCTDPIAKYYAAFPGDIFKIERNSKTAGQYTSFRYVVQ